jgi:tetratricopeptide (TPR) repeat protein
MRSHGASVAVRCCVVVLLSDITLGGAPTSGQDQDPLLAKAFHAYSVNDLAAAKKYLADFDSQRSQECGPDVLDHFLRLQYAIAREEISAAGTPSSEAIRTYVADYGSVRDRYLQLVETCRRSGNSELYAEEFSSYQNILWQHVGFLQNLGAHDFAIEELYSARRTVSDSQDALASSSSMSVKNPQGQIVDRSVTLREKYNIADAEQLQQCIITACNLRTIDRPGDESKAKLIQAYNEYVTSYPTYAKAGPFLNRRMELEGRVDLDALVDIYKKCECKDSEQYNGSILGLSNLLIDAGRGDDAMFFLKQIQVDRIPGSRVAEMHYAMGNAYELQGDTLNALKQYNVVRTMTTKYRDVSRRIEKITGISAFVLDNLVRDILSDGRRRGLAKMASEEKARAFADRAASNAATRIVDHNVTQHPIPLGREGRTSAGEATVTPLGRGRWSAIMGIVAFASACLGVGVWSARRLAMRGRLGE